MVEGNVLTGRRRSSAARGSLGLVEAQLLAGRLRKFWAVVMVTTALAAMSAPRRRRKEESQNILKIKKATTLKSTVAVARFKRGTPTKPRKKKLEFSFSSLINGFGKFLISDFF